MGNVTKKASRPNEDASANERNALCALPAAPQRLVAECSSVLDMLRVQMTCRAAPAPDLHTFQTLGGELVWQRADGLRFEGRRDGENSIFCRLAQYKSTNSNYGPEKVLDTEPGFETIQVCDGLRALALVQNDALVDIGTGATAADALPSSDGYREIKGTQLPESGWSVATWSLVQDGKLARPGYALPPSMMQRNNRWGQALLAGGHYTDAFVCYFDCERPPKVVDTVRFNQKGFGVLLSSWHDSRELDGNDPDHLDTGEHYHYEPANLSLDGLSDGWHHIAVVADNTSLCYYIDGSLHQTFAISKPTMRKRKGWGIGDYIFTDPVADARKTFTAAEWGGTRMDAIGNTPPLSDEGTGGQDPWGLIADFRLFPRKLSEKEISLLIAPVRAKM